MNGRRQALVAAAGAGALCVLGMTGAQAGAPARHTGTEHILIVQTQGQAAPTVLHGPIEATAIDNEVDSGRDAVILTDGQFIIHHPSSGATFSADINPRSCAGSITLTGSYTINAGTGAYAGIRGSGTYLLVQKIVLQHVKSGACGGEPTIGYGVVHASGPISLP